MEAASASNSYLLERKWVEQSPRYGELDEIGQAVVAELDAAYTEERLKQLLQAALLDEAPKETYRQKVTVHMLDAYNWRDRYAVLAYLTDTKYDVYILLNMALEVDQPSVIRLYTVEF